MICLPNTHEVLLLVDQLFENKNSAHFGVETDIKTIAFHDTCYSHTVYKNHRPSFTIKIRQRLNFPAHLIRPIVTSNTR